MAATSTSSRLTLCLAGAVLLMSCWPAVAATPPGAEEVKLHRDLRACRKEARNNDAEFGAAGMEETAVNTDGLLQCNIAFCRGERKLLAAHQLSQPTSWCAKPKYR
jgi:hypothetical protein